MSKLSTSTNPFVRKPIGNTFSDSNETRALQKLFRELTNFKDAQFLARDQAIHKTIENIFLVLFSVKSREFLLWLIENQMTYELLTHNTVKRAFCQDFAFVVYSFFRLLHYDPMNADSLGAVLPFLSSTTNDIALNTIAGSADYPLLNIVKDVSARWVQGTISVDIIAQQVAESIALETKHYTGVHPSEHQSTNIFDKLNIQARIANGEKDAGATAQNNNKQNNNNNNNNGRTSCGISSQTAAGSMMNPYRRPSESCVSQTVVSQMYNANTGGILSTAPNQLQQTSTTGGGPPPLMQQLSIAPASGPASSIIACSPQQFNTAPSGSNEISKVENNPSGGSGGTTDNDNNNKNTTCLTAELSLNVCGGERDDTADIDSGNNTDLDNNNNKLAGITSPGGIAPPAPRRPQRPPRRNSRIAIATIAGNGLDGDDTTLERQSSTLGGATGSVKDGMTNGGGIATGTTAIKHIPAVSLQPLSIPSDQVWATERNIVSRIVANITSLIHHALLTTLEHGRDSIDINKVQSDANSWVTNTFEIIALALEELHGWEDTSVVFYRLVLSAYLSLFSQKVSELYKPESTTFILTACVHELGHVIEQFTFFRPTGNATYLYRTRARNHLSTYQSAGQQQVPAHLQASMNREANEKLSQIREVYQLLNEHGYTHSITLYRQRLEQIYANVYIGKSGTLDSVKTENSTLPICVPEYAQSLVTQLYLELLNINTKDTTQLPPPSNQVPFGLHLDQNGCPDLFLIEKYVYMIGCLGYASPDKEFLRPTLKEFYPQQYPHNKNLYGKQTNGGAPGGNQMMDDNDLRSSMTAGGPLLPRNNDKQQQQQQQQQHPSLINPSTGTNFAPHVQRYERNVNIPPAPNQTNTNNTTIISSSASTSTNTTPLQLQHPNQQRQTPQPPPPQPPSLIQQSTPLPVSTPSAATTLGNGMSVTLQHLPGMNGTGDDSTTIINDTASIAGSVVMQNNSNNNNNINVNNTDNLGVVTPVQVKFTPTTNIIQQYQQQCELDDNENGVNNNAGVNGNNNGNNNFMRASTLGKNVQRPEHNSFGVLQMQANPKDNIGKQNFKHLETTLHKATLKIFYNNMVSAHGFFSAVAELLLNVFTLPILPSTAYHFPYHNFYSDALFKRILPPSTDLMTSSSLLDQFATTQYYPQDLIADSMNKAMGPNGEYITNNIVVNSPNTEQLLQHQQQFAQYQQQQQVQSRSPQQQYQQQYQQQHGNLGYSQQTPSIAPSHHGHHGQHHHHHGHHHHHHHHNGHHNQNNLNFVPLSPMNQHSYGATPASPYNAGLAQQQQQQQQQHYQFNNLQQSAPPSGQQQQQLHQAPQKPAPPQRAFHYGGANAPTSSSQQHQQQQQQNNNNNAARAASFQSGPLPPPPPLPSMITGIFGALGGGDKDKNNNNNNNNNNNPPQPPPVPPQQNVNDLTAARRHSSHIGQTIQPSGQYHQHYQATPSQQHQNLHQQTPQQQYYGQHQQLTPSSAMNGVSGPNLVRTSSGSSSHHNGMNQNNNSWHYQQQNQQMQHQNQQMQQQQPLGRILPTHTYTQPGIAVAGAPLLIAPPTLKIVDNNNNNNNNNCEPLTSPIIDNAFQFNQIHSHKQNVNTTFLSTVDDETYQQQHHQHTMLFSPQPPQTNNNNKDAFIIDPIIPNGALFCNNLPINPGFCNQLTLSTAMYATHGPQNQLNHLTIKGYRPYIGQFIEKASSRPAFMQIPSGHLTMLIIEQLKLLLIKRRTPFAQRNAVVANEMYLTQDTKWRFQIQQQHLRDLQSAGQVQQNNLSSGNGNGNNNNNNTFTNQILHYPAWAPLIIPAHHIPVSVHTNNHIYNHGLWCPTSVPNAIPVLPSGQAATAATNNDIESYLIKVVDGQVKQEVEFATQKVMVPITTTLTQTNVNTSVQTGIERGLHNIKQTLDNYVINNLQQITTDFNIAKDSIQQQHNDINHRLILLKQDEERLNIQKLQLQQREQELQRQKEEFEMKKQLLISQPNNRSIVPTTDTNNSTTRSSSSNIRQAPIIPPLPVSTNIVEPTLLDTTPKNDKNNNNSLTNVGNSSSTQQQQQYNMQQPQRPLAAPSIPPTVPTHAERRASSHVLLSDGNQDPSVAILMATTAASSSASGASNISINNHNKRDENVSIKQQQQQQQLTITAPGLSNSNKQPPQSLNLSLVHGADEDDDDDVAMAMLLSNTQNNNSTNNNNTINNTLEQEQHDESILNENNYTLATPQRPVSRGIKIGNDNNNQNSNTSNNNNNNSFEMCLSTPLVHSGGGGGVSATLGAATPGNAFLLASPLPPAAVVSSSNDDGNDETPSGLSFLAQLAEGDDGDGGDNHNISNSNNNNNENNNNKQIETENINNDHNNINNGDGEDDQFFAQPRGHIEDDMLMQHRIANNNNLHQHNDDGLMIGGSGNDSLSTADTAQLSGLGSPILTPSSMMEMSKLTSLQIPIQQQQQRMMNNNNSTALSLFAQDDNSKSNSNSGMMPRNNQTDNTFATPQVMNNNNNNNQSLQQQQYSNNNNNNNNNHENYEINPDYLISPIVIENNGNDNNNNPNNNNNNANNNSINNNVALAATSTGAAMTLEASDTAPSVPPLPPMTPEVSPQQQQTTINNKNNNDYKPLTPTLLPQQANPNANSSMMLDQPVYVIANNTGNNNNNNTQQQQNYPEVPHRPSASSFSRTSHDYTATHGRLSLSQQYSSSQLHNSSNNNNNNNSAQTALSTLQGASTTSSQNNGQYNSMGQPYSIIAGWPQTVGGYTHAPDIQQQQQYQQQVQQQQQQQQQLPPPLPQQQQQQQQAQPPARPQAPVRPARKAPVAPGAAPQRPQ